MIVDAANVEPPESQLLADAMAGVPEARRLLFERYRTPAYQVALRVTGRNEDALDVVQDSFIAAFEKLDRFERDASFKTWFLRIVTNRALDLLRARRVRLAVPLEKAAEDEAAPQLAVSDTEARGLDRLAQRELAARLQAAVAALPPEQKAVFGLYATGDMTYAEIAEVLGVPIGTVMSRLFHARRRLRELLPDLAPADVSA